MHSRETSLDLQKWNLFAKVAEHGSLTRAASALGAAPSAISRQISHLEQDCGGRLFNRTGRGLTLTALGERILPRINSLLAEAERLAIEIDSSAGIPSGEVRIGLVPSLGDPLVSNLFSMVRKRFPEVRLHFIEGSSGQLDAALVDGSIDMAVLFRFSKAEAGDEQPLARVDTFLAGPIGDPITRKATVQFARLDQLPLVLPDMPNGLRVVLDQHARKCGITLSVILEANSLLIQRNLAGAGTAHAILAGPAVWKEMRAGLLQASRIVNPDIERIITLASSKRRPSTLACREVARMIRQIVDGIATELRGGQLRSVRGKSRRMA
jgi:LysR family nitrogen assimilation transcriptional regulator